MNTTTAHLSKVTYYLMRNQNSKNKEVLFPIYNTDLFVLADWPIGYCSGLVM